MLSAGRMGKQLPEGVDSLQNMFIVGLSRPQRRDERLAAARRRQRRRRPRLRRHRARQDHAL